MKKKGKDTYAAQLQETVMERHSLFNCFEIFRDTRLVTVSHQRLEISYFVLNFTDTQHPQLQALTEKVVATLQATIDCVILEKSKLENTATEALAEVGKSLGKTDFAEFNAFVTEQKNSLQENFDELTHLKDTAKIAWSNIKSTTLKTPQKTVEKKEEKKKTALTPRHQTWLALLKLCGYQLKAKKANKQQQEIVKTSADLLLNWVQKSNSAIKKEHALEYVKYAWPPNEYAFNVPYYPDQVICAVTMVILFRDVARKLKKSSKKPPQIPAIRLKVTTHTKTYTVRLLERNNPLAWCPGLFTQCCHHTVNEAGQPLAKIGATNPKAGVYMIYARGRPVAMSLCYEAIDGAFVFNMWTRLKHEIRDDALNNVISALTIALTQSGYKIIRVGTSVPYNEGLKALYPLTTLTVKQPLLQLRQDGIITHSEILCKDFPPSGLLNLNSAEQKVVTPIPPEKGGYTVTTLESNKAADSMKSKKSSQDKKTIKKTAQPVAVTASRQASQRRVLSGSTQATTNTVPAISRRQQETKKPKVKNSI